jgi:hypothetical protein
VEEKVNKCIEIDHNYYDCKINGYLNALSTLFGKIIDKTLFFLNLKSNYSAQKIVEIIGFMV